MNEILIEAKLQLMEASTFLSAAISDPSSDIDLDMGIKMLRMVNSYLIIINDLEYFSNSMIMQISNFGKWAFNALSKAS